MSGKRKSVLIVEDEAIVAIDIQMTIEELGWKTRVVGTGEKALEACAEELPDLVLMDIMLRGRLDGVDTASRIRDLHGTEVGIVYLTGLSTKEAMERAYGTRPLAYIYKPFGEEQLKRELLSLGTDTPS